MNKDEVQSEFLNLLEKSLISVIPQIIKNAGGPEIDEKGARNILGKIGVRILFGKKEEHETISK